MSLNFVSNPYAYYNARNKGKPIFNGKIYVGVPDLDPKIVANQLPVTAKMEDGTQVPIAQPISTNSGGYAVDTSGNIVVLLVDGNYAIRVDDAQGQLALEQADVNDGVPITVTNGVSRVDTIADLRDFEPTEDGQSIFLVSHTVQGYGGGHFYFDATDTGAPDNNGTVIVTPLGNRWKREVEAFIDVGWFGAGQGLGDDSPRIRAAYDSANNGAIVDSARSFTPIKGYAKEYILNTSLILGDTNATAIVDIEIMGNFITLSTLPFAIKLRHFKSPQIKLGRMQPTASGQNVGLVIENVFGGDIYCSLVGGYRVPINFLGDASYGTLGNGHVHFTCPQAGATGSTVNVIELSTVNSGYCNSLKIEVTFARGDVFSKHTKGAGQTDPYNQNVYMTCGLEDIAVTGFDWEFSKFSAVEYPRLESPGAHFSNNVIAEDSDCSGNTYNLFTLTLTKLGTLNGSSIANGQFLDSGGSVRYKQATSVGVGLIVHSDSTNASETPNRSVFTYGNTSATSDGKPFSRYRGFFKDDGGTIHPYGIGTPFEIVRVNSYTAGDVVDIGFATTVEIGSNNGALDLRSHQERQMEGFEIILNLKSTIVGLTFSNFDGSTSIASTAFPDRGVYMIKRIDFRWRVTKIGDRFEVS